MSAEGIALREVGGAGVSDGNPGGTLVVFKLGGAPVKKLPVAIPGLVPKSHRPSLTGKIKLNPFMYVTSLALAR